MYQTVTHTDHGRAVHNQLKMGQDACATLAGGLYYTPLPIKVCPYIVNMLIVARLWTIYALSRTLCRYTQMHDAVNGARA